LSHTSRGAGKIQELEKAASHIAGFDEILFGGLPEGRTTLIEGGPGTGKSILGLEFLYRGALVGQAGIFVAFEEQAKAVRRNALTLGWDIEALEQAGTLSIIEAHLDPGTVVSGDFNINGLLAIIEGQSRSIKAKRIVFDAMDVLLRLYEDPGRERGEMYALHEWLLSHEMTAILTVKAPHGNSSGGRYEFLEYMADCVVRLVQRPGEWVSTRELQVLKYRGSDFGRNAYPFVIQPGGVHVIPISEFGLQHKPLGPHVSTGNADLDILLGGGYRKGSAILVAGFSGTGKTTIANTFVKAACERGERVLFLGFEESQESMVETMLSPGIDLRPAIESGRLKLVTAMPEAFATEKHLVLTFMAVDEFQPDHVVVDAISAFDRMGTSRAAFEFAMRLVNRGKDRGITVLLVNQTAGVAEDRHTISGLGISSIIDTILWLRFVEAGDSIKRNLLVIKSRGSRHSNNYRDFSITDHGVKLARETPSGRPPRRRGAGT
jgi:circadian clock protein KaiC